MSIVVICTLNQREILNSINRIESRSDKVYKERKSDGDQKDSDRLPED